MSIFSKITRRTMQQNKARTLVTLAGVVLSTAMITAAATFAASLQQYLVNSSLEQEGGWHGMAEGLPREGKESLEQDPRLEMTAAAAVMGHAKPELLSGSPAQPYLYLESFSEEFFRMVPVKLYEGRLPETDREILIPTSLNEVLGDNQIRVGDTLELELGERWQGDEQLGPKDEWQSGENARLDGELAGEEEIFVPRETVSCTVVGTYDSLPWSWIQAGHYVIAGPGAEAESYRALFTMENMRDIYAYKTELSQTYADCEVEIHNDLLQWYGVGDNKNLVLVLVSLLAIVIGLIMVGAISLIYNAFSISLRERTWQFGLLSSAGATKKQLKKALNYEARSISLVGIPLGVLSGLLGIGVTLQFIGPMMADWIHGSNSSLQMTLKVSWTALAAAAVIAAATVKLSVWIPARRLKRISPMEAIRASQDVKIQNRRVRSGGLAGRLFGLEGMLASKNYRRDRRKYRTTVVSLTLSIVLFVTGGSLVKYLTRAGEEVFLSTDMDISVELNRRADAEEARRELEQIEGIEALHASRRVRMTLPAETDMLSEEGENYGFDGADGKTYLECQVYVLPDSSFAEYAREQGEDPEDYLGKKTLRGIYSDRLRVLDEETQQYRNISLLDISLPEQVEMGRESFDLEGESLMVIDFEPWLSVSLTCKAEEKPRESVDGYYSDIITVVVPESAFAALGGNVPEEDIFQELALEASEHKEVTRRLTDLSNDSASALYQSSVYDVRAAYEQDQNIVLVIRVLTGGFITLMSLVAVANIFNTISTNLFLRRREFAMLRSVGMTQKGFRRMMGCECLIYGLRSIFYGVAISAGTSFLVYRSTSFGVLYPYSLPWLYWGIAAAAVLAVVAGTMVYSMRRMKRDNIIDVLKRE